MSVLGKQMDLKTIQAAPALLLNFKHIDSSKLISQRGIAVPEQRYSGELLDSLRVLIANVHLSDKNESQSLRGTIAAVTIDHATGEKRSVESPDGLIHAGAY